ncbi:methyltransferase domain-containing protein [Lutimonas saemankumensis]|uniref:methyltransferase domain-containing protein n=1 Tax=Lutimonas saemankumensis TaxID=483016 RepID=UPI001CD4869D|nr:methyltransferase domain-containing protein [Lutimonas saemankumensis]MCA0932199.1 methyltransferase domain-containing protein [Lutimonas saemankumensis]
MISTRYRSEQREIMDDFTMRGKDLRDNLDILSRINWWLGGNHVSLDGIDKILKSENPKGKVKIVDLGCGNGDMLRRIANMGLQKGYQFELIGIDANADTIAYAAELSNSHNNISYFQLDIFSKEFEELEYDIAVSTLFLHHLKDEEIISKLNLLCKNASLGVVINDLHRNKLAYFLFNIISFFINNKIIRNDGLISILRGFKKDELEHFSKMMGMRFEIAWKWAFRYQWLLYSKNES